eukprot:CAMPEP_0174927096 /NCGR_PEP_ID=MMETSP1355-20121228/17955_1 /TAXON_ID=464990 /ORGANISM="Hemiselmis tepida, Strain CCMP443" /LENGTH=147 /DNA_ID=CAMNT_0016173183 /DNA_START=55 /DNA_END=493 /DNA_ORIENTATION=-
MVWENDYHHHQQHPPMACPGGWCPSCFPVQEVFSCSAEGDAMHSTAFLDNSLPSAQCGDPLSFLDVSFDGNFAYLGPRRWAPETSDALSDKFASFGISPAEEGELAQQHASTGQQPGGFYALCCALSPAGPAVLAAALGTVVVAGGG